MEQTTEADTQTCTTRTHKQKDVKRVISGAKKQTNLNSTFRANHDRLSGAYITIYTHTDLRQLIETLMREQTLALAHTHLLTLDDAGRIGSRAHVRDEILSLHSRGTLKSIYYIRTCEVRSIG